jgi:hypothetical protein
MVIWFTSNPPGWRKPSNDKADFAGMFDLMTKDHHVIYLSIHQDKVNI